MSYQKFEHRTTFEKINTVIYFLSSMNQSRPDVVELEAVINNPRLTIFVDNDQTVSKFRTLKKDNPKLDGVDIVAVPTQNVFDFDKMRGWHGYNLFTPAAVSQILRKLILNEPNFFIKKEI